MNKITRISINSHLCDVVRFGEINFQQIKHFILELCKGLEDPTYFITDDIDTELPFLLKEKYGLVYGILCGNNIIALQAIDYDRNKTLNFHELLGIGKSNNIMEVGWAMVDTLYRGQNLSVYLSNLLEQAAYKETCNEICVATVHPKNTSSLFLFLKLGYIGVKLTCHYNVIRLIMTKKLNSHFPIDPTQETIIVKDDDYNQQTQLTENGYVCYGAFVEQKSVFLNFVKKNCNALPTTRGLASGGA